MDEVLRFLKEAGTYYLATTDGDQPRVRPFGTISEFEGKLYLQTGRVKDVFKQMGRNAKIELCAMGKEGAWIRVAAVAQRDDRVEARRHLLSEYPALEKMYSADDGNCEVLYLKDATATFFSFGGAPRVVKF
ncbi:MAG: pyridoxamine 5'-phosphate oxidase family protein [Peptococcaceae bacterium]|jgi:uncharacterized pyridoxamine 5'-phosphate oxidase family protein|nr:pyridoxamine 5'-phosphate oxidase family protein [Peptococcaceae bacterium]